MGDFREQDAVRIILLKLSEDGETWEPVTDPGTGGGGGGGAVDSVDGRTGVVTLTDLYQPIDSDLTAIAALTTTPFGRALLTQADGAALVSAMGLGTASTHDTADFDAAGAATTAAAAALASAEAYAQPVDTDLTAIAALTTTSFGRALLALASVDAAATYLHVSSIGVDITLGRRNMSF